MRLIRLGRTNVRVPAISLGTWGHGGERVSATGESVGWSGHDDAQAKQALITAWRNGITHWDTADVYGDGNAERLIGEVFEAPVPRRHIFLATKFGWDQGPAKHPYDPKHMRDRCERSLRLLRTDVIDLYYFHHCDFGPNDQYFDGALETMHRFRDEGKIRFIGLSDWDARKIVKFADRVNPEVVQPYRNLVDDDYESSGLKAWVDEHDAGVAFFSPLKHGLLLGKYDKPVDYGTGDFRSNVEDFRDPAAIERYKRAAQAMRDRFGEFPEPVLHAVTGALLSGNPSACVLLGQRNPKQAEAAAVVGDALTAEEAAWVREQYRA